MSAVAAVRRLGAMVTEGVWRLGFAARFFLMLLVYKLILLH